MRIHSRNLRARFGVVIVTTAVVSRALAQGVEIHEDSGTFLGHLQLSTDGRTLVLALREGLVQTLGVCVDEPISELRNPLGNLLARHYVRNCGATVDFATHVAVTSTGSDLVVAVFSGRPNVELSWTSESELEIRHSNLDGSEVFLSATVAPGFTVAYVETGTRAGTTEQELLDLANVNFGATGLAAGIPRELLLRMAGWSQEASLMHRDVWGSWRGESPYGDDPEGRRNIQRGFEYFEQLEAEKQ